MLIPFAKRRTIINSRCPSEHPEQIVRQRVEYIHNNPVEAGFVYDPQRWKWSIAHDYCGGTQGLIDLVMLL